MPPLVHTSTRTQPLVAPVILLLLATSLAGCLDAPADAPRPADESIASEPEPEPSEPTGNVTAAIEKDRVPLRFPLDRPVDASYAYDGSFAPAETGLGGGFFTGGFVKEIDLTDVVPAEVPTRLDITVTLDAEHFPVVGPTARADPVANGTVWYETYRHSPTAGMFVFGGIVKRTSAGTLGVSLEAYTPGTTDPSRLDYMVEVNVTARPDAVPVGVPVAVTLGDEEAVTFETGEDQQAELLVYGPDDRLLDRLYFLGSEPWTVPAGSGGELVVVPIWGAGELRILGGTDDDGTASTLRALGLDRTLGERHALGTMETTTWDFTVKERPLRILVTVLGPPGEAWTCVGTLDVALRAPSGPVLERTAECPSPTNVPFMYEERRAWASHPGDPWLVAGDYAVAVDNTLWEGHVAYHTVETYVR